MTAREYDDLKRRVEQLQRSAAQAEGALAEHRKQMKEQYRCGTVEEAQMMLLEMEAAAAEAELAASTARKKFEEEYKERIEGAR